LHGIGGLPVNDLRLLKLDALDQLRRSADAWDDLWRRSYTTRPVAQASTLAHWIEHFAPTSRFSALVVERADGRLAAGLPLVGRRVGGVFGAGVIPHNEWSPAGDLLLERSCVTSAAAQELVQGLRQLPWSFVWMDKVPLDAPHWRAFRTALAADGVSHDYGHLFDVGTIDLEGDWRAYRFSWSKNHRRNVDKALRRLRRTGSVELELHSSPSEDAIRPLLRRGFEIEDRSWKGRTGTSVLRSPDMLPFYIGQARRLASAGALELAFLNCGGRSIAFEYGLTAKGVFHALKAGYDAEFAPYSPGQLLMHELLKRFYDDVDRRQYDCMGQLSDAMERWRPRKYPIGQLVIALPKLLGRVMWHAYCRWPPWLKSCAATA
jgi:CelD/BcsL family acetyltransferase involved in cellulose biosynthesis